MRVLGMLAPSFLAFVSGCACGAPAPLDAAAGEVDSGEVDAATGDDAPAPVVDAPVPMPTIDEPDVEPGERPSDHDEDWLDPPPASSDPCCAVGEPVPLSPPGVFRPSGRPLTAWDGATWGAVWRFDHDPIQFVRLDRGATRSFGPIAMDTTPMRPTSLAWGAGVFGLVANAVTGDTPARVALLVFDREGAVRRDDTLAPDSSDSSLARFPLVHGWAIALRNGPAGSSTGQLFVVDDAGTRLVDRPLPLLDGASSSGITVVSLLSRFVLVRTTSDGPYADTFAGADATEGPSSIRLAPEGMWPLSATALRDSVVVAMRVLTDGTSRIDALALDPFAGIVTTPARTVVPATGPNHPTPRLANDDRGGTALMVWPSAAGESTAVHGCLLDPTGAAIGPPFTIATVRGAFGVAVGSSGLDEYVVLFTSEDATARHYGVTVHVRR